MEEQNLSILAVTLLTLHSGVGKWVNLMVQYVVRIVKSRVVHSWLDVILHYSWPALTCRGRCEVVWMWFKVKTGLLHHS